MKRPHAKQLRMHALSLRRAGWSIALMIAGLGDVMGGQSARPGSLTGNALHGRVVDVQGHPVAAANVTVGTGKAEVRTKSDGEGKFSLPLVADESYLLSAEKTGYERVKMSVRRGDGLTVVLKLQGSSGGSSTGMEFADEPHFSVAGVTDWTAAGGHGSDAILRTSESLTDSTVALKTGVSPESGGGSDDASRESLLRATLERLPNDFAAQEGLGELYVRQRRFQAALPLLIKASGLEPTSLENSLALAEAYDGVGDPAKARAALGPALMKSKSARADFLAGRFDEELGDALQAVRELKVAAEAEPSEENEFELASELLRHRAISQAEQVFRGGAGAHPFSVRMHAGFGASLFAGSHYQEAAVQFCKASDLDPGLTSPYVSLGEIAIASPNPLSCVQPALKRFVTMHPESATANYMYAMALLKDRPDGTAERATAKDYLQRAVLRDSTCGEAYLQLGVLASAQHDAQAAIDFYLKAIQAKPELADAHYRLAVAYDRVGERARATQEFALHQQMKNKQMAAVEEQRKAIKQFLFEQSSEPRSAPLK